MLTTNMIYTLDGTRTFAVSYVAALALGRLGWQPDASVDPMPASIYWTATRQWDRCVAMGTSAIAAVLAWAAPYQPYVHKKREALVREWLGIPFLDEEMSLVTALLGRMGPSALDVLIAALTTSTANWSARPDITMWITNMGDTLEFLLPRGQSDPALAGEIERLVSRLHQTAYEMLLAIDDPITPVLLIPALSHPDLQVRQLAVRLLGAMPDNRVIGPLVTNFDLLPADLTVQTLTKIGGPEVIDALLVLLRRTSSGALSYVCQALARISSPKVTEALRVQLQRSPGKEAFTIAAALAPLGDDGAITWLIESVRQTYAHDSAEALGSAFRSPQLTAVQRARIKQHGHLKVIHTYEESVTCLDDRGERVSGLTGSTLSQRRRLEDYL